MTQTPPSFDALPLAVYRERQDALLVAEIEGGLPAVEASDDQPGQPALPALLVQFKVPDPVDCAIIEARGREALLNLMQGRGADVRYGLSLTTLDETAIAALAPFVTAVESALHLVKAWNYALPGPDGAPVRAPITAETVSQLFRGRPVARAGWTLQFDNASPLERAEGNASAASPDTISATAANTAGAAPSAEADAAGAASA